jgi:hypothetical protein
MLQVEISLETFSFMLEKIQHVRKLEMTIIVYLLNPILISLIIKIIARPDETDSLKMN